MIKRNIIFIVSVVVVFVILVSWGLVSRNTQDSGIAFLEELQKESKQNKIVREPAVAGQFYPADPQELSGMVDQFLDAAEPVKTEGEILALILPHAGYQFSGPVAAYGLKTLVNKQFDTVIVIGNSHQEQFEGISVFPKGYFKTPLGEVEVDSELAEKIMAENERIFFKESTHTKEHSLEVQLPFLQKVLKSFKIVPLIFGNGSSDDYKILASALLKNIKNRNVLLIASSDLSHYPSYEDAYKADLETAGAILSGKVEKLEEKIRELEKEGVPNAVTFACGMDAIKTVMLMAQEMGADEIKLLNYANSGDTEAGDRSRVVGYGAIGFFGNKELSSLQKELSSFEQQELLEIVRASVESFVRTKSTPEFAVENPKLKENLGAFVTLKKNGELRGCIGRFSPIDIPLYQVISQMAIAAATQDVRFTPVKENELDELTYEISVLSALKKIDDWQEIELGKHGVQIRRGLRSGVFLPQVATDNDWDLETFMGELCSQKAGLEWDCWKKKDTELFVFTAQVFEE